jgi:hypothetical protein
MTNEYLETMNARALDDCSADPIPEPGQVFTVDGAALVAVPVEPIPEAPHPAFPEPQITHFVGDSCPGGHEDDFTHYVNGDCQVSVPVDLASDAAVVREAFGLMGCQ